MKIKITPTFLVNLTLDTATETAVMKSNIARAKKLATAQNLLGLLSQHYGTARTLGSGDTAGASTDRWFDCAPHALPTIIDSNCLNEGIHPTLTSIAGILTVESNVSPNSSYRHAYQNMRLYIPLDPNDSVTIQWGKYGYYVNCSRPIAVYNIEVDL